MPERLALVLEPQEMQVEVALRKKLAEQTHFRVTLSQTNFPVELQVQASPLEAPTTPLRLEQSVQVPAEVRKEVVAQVQAARLRFQAVPALQLHLMPSELLLEPGRVEQAVQTPLSEYWVREQRHLNFLASQVKPVLQSHLPSVEVFLAPGMAEQEEQESLARR